MSCPKQLVVAHSSEHSRCLRAAPPAANACARIGASYLTGQVGRRSITSGMLRSMSQDIELHPRRAGAYLATGLVVTLVALFLLFTGRTGMVSWMGLGLGSACLLVGAAQRNSLRHPPTA